MISNKIEQALNNHLKEELSASLQYLAMASWCDTNGMDGAAQFFYAQSHEENLHFIKLFKYINEVDGHAIVPQADQPKNEFKNIVEICESAYKNEQAVTKSIYKLVELSNVDEDHVTSEFLRFYVQEQREEETLFRAILDKIKLIGDGPQSLYYIDKELAGLGGTAPEPLADV